MKLESSWSVCLHWSISDFLIVSYRVVAHWQLDKPAGVLGDFIEVEVTEDDEVGRDSVVGELVIGDITMRVAAGFDSAELARLLDVVRSRC